MKPEALIEWLDDRIAVADAGSRLMFVQLQAELTRLRAVAEAARELSDCWEEWRQDHTSDYEPTTAIFQAADALRTALSALEDR